MKNTLKIVLSLAILGSTLMADDGDQQNGGRTDCNNPCIDPPPCTLPCDPNNSGMAMQGDPDAGFNAIVNAVDLAWKADGVQIVLFR